MNDSSAGSTGTHAVKFIDGPIDGEVRDIPMDTSHWLVPDRPQPHFSAEIVTPFSSMFEYQIIETRIFGAEVMFAVPTGFPLDDVEALLRRLLVAFIRGDMKKGDPE